MNFSIVTLFAVILSGPLYYGVYRGVFYDRLQWRMVHSLWIPFAILGYQVIVLFLDLRMADPTGWEWIESIPAFMNFLYIAIAVLIFALIYGAFSYWDGHKKRN